MGCEETKEQVRVAIVGSGLAGLVTAYLLQQDARKRYSVTVFESGKELSLDSASLSVPSHGGNYADRIDLPMRAFAGGFYRNLKALYDYLGIQYHAQPFLFHFTRTPSPNSEGLECGESSSYFVYPSNLHHLPKRPEKMTTTKYMIEIMYLLTCYAWYTICCVFIRPNSGVSDDQTSETFERYLRRIRLPAYFVTYYLLPLMSSVATCSHGELLKFPASDLTEYKKRTQGAQHYTVSSGVHGVQRVLAKGIDVQMHATVLSVESQGSRVRLSWRHTEDSHGLAEPSSDFFDRVVLAVSPDIVQRIFLPLEHEMAQIPTLLVESTIHTDDDMQPKSREATSREPRLSVLGRRSTYPAQNIQLHTVRNGDGYRTESIHSQPSGTVVTTCPFTPIDPTHIIHSARFIRVLRTPQSKRIVNSIFDGSQPLHSPDTEKPVPRFRNGDMGVWLVGGWCWDGMVLLEGCMVSAIRVADDFDVAIPWRDNVALEARGVPQ